MTFIGRFYHALEQKGRVSIPKAYREQLTSTAYLTKGLEGSLFLYPEPAWQSLTSRLHSLPQTKKVVRDWIRLTVQSAHAVTLDRLGRIRIPEHLIEAAQLKKDVVIAGSLTHLELWDRDRYHLYLAEISTTAESIAEELSELK